MEASAVVSKAGANNPLWQAPEVIQFAKYTKGSDVWAFAIIMWEMLTGEIPWNDDNTWAVSS